MSKKKSGLGKGLGALIPTGAPQVQSHADEQTAASSPPESALQTIPVSQITPNPYQPRTEFDPAALNDLAESIKEHGLIQPLIVNREPSGEYTLIAGERRWRASQIAQLKEVPVVVKNDITALKMLELAIIENVQRADLNAVEEAMAYQQLSDEFGMTHEEIAQRVSKHRTVITNTINLLKLPERIRRAVINKEINAGHAKVLKGLDTPEMQLDVFNLILKHELNVRQVEALVKKRKQTKKPTKAPPKMISPEMADVLRQFEERLRTPVEIQDSKNGGKIVIHYTSLEEFNAIYDTILND